MNKELSLVTSSIQDPSWDKDLPRTINPATGKDDTELRKKACEEAYKLRHYNTPDQVNSLRRGLYMSIHRLRTETNIGWVLDGKVTKGVRRAGVLHMAHAHA